MAEGARGGSPSSPPSGSTSWRYQGREGGREGGRKGGREEYLHEGVVDLLEEDSASERGVHGFAGLDDLPKGDGTSAEGQDGGSVGGGVEHT